MDLIAKTLNPALAGVEAMRRYQRGDTKGALVSGIQALGGPIGFGAGVVNALRKSQPIADPVDTNKIASNWRCVKKTRSYSI